MSLRGLYRYIYEKSQTYIVRDGKHVYAHWRRAHEVHALAKQYLQTRIPGVNNASMRASQACQDLMELKLLRCVENNEQRR